MHISRFSPPAAEKEQQASFVLLLLQGFLFAFVGMCAGLTGTVLSNALLLTRQKLDPNFKSQNEAPNVPLNAATWAAHMGISSNVRYQVLNGIDMVSYLCPTPTMSLNCLQNIST